MRAECGWEREVSVDQGDGTRTGSKRVVRKGWNSFAVLSARAPSDAPTV